MPTADTPSCAGHNDTCRSPLETCQHRVADRWQASRNVGRMQQSSTLRTLLDHGAAVRTNEAVAIVQQLMCDAGHEGDAHQPYGPLSLDNVEIASDGRVHCVGTAATPSVYEAAALLQALLNETRGAIPGALRYTLGRALLEVDAPPFDSRQQFGDALERFERGPRAEVIAALYARAVSRRSRAVDRRQTTATPAMLRRELRDADLRLFAATTATVPDARPQQPRASAGPIAACLLAGASLIVVGGAASTERTPTASAPARVTQHVAARERDIALEAESTTITTVPAAPLVATPGRSAASAARKSSVQPSARRVAASPMREPRPALRTRVRPRRDPDRGVIARIRFEWNNPFR